MGMLAASLGGSESTGLGRREPWRAKTGPKSVFNLVDVKRIIESVLSQGGMCGLEEDDSG